MSCGVGGEEVVVVVVVDVLGLVVVVEEEVELDENYFAYSFLSLCLHILDRLPY